jgi:glucokinase
MNSSAKNTKIIGIDLGGTKVSVGLFENNKLIDKQYRLIPSNNDNPEDLIHLIIELVSQLIDDSVIGIGIGVPSLVNREKGIVYQVQNIPSWEKVHLADILKNEFKIPVYLDNDANCFAIGEYKFGAGQNCDNFVGITLGTGMGAGIITNKHLLKDANCGSGEFGSIPYLDGIYEDYCSGKFFKTHYNETGENLLSQAKEGNKRAIQAFHQFGKHLGNAIKTIMLSVDPKEIIIGGSVSSSKEFFIDSLMKSVEDFPYPNSVKNLKIKFSKTQNIAILGAASLIYDRTEE